MKKYIYIYAYIATEEDEIDLLIRADNKKEAESILKNRFQQKDWIFMGRKLENEIKN